MPELPPSKRRPPQPGRRPQQVESDLLPEAANRLPGVAARGEPAGASAAIPASPGDALPAPRDASQGRDASHARDASQGYAELHCRTNFSFLEGASHPDELVHTAAALGYHALAITDRNSLAGIVRAHVAAREVGLKLLVGAEITPCDAPPVVLLALDRIGYGRLCRLITTGRRRAPKGECHLTFQDVAEHADGLLACVPLATVRPAEPAGVLPAADVARYRQAFGERCYALAELAYGADDQRQLQQMAAVARQAGVPLAAGGNVYYHAPERQPLHDVLTAIRHGCTVAELGVRRLAHGQHHLHRVEEMARRFAAVPQAVPRTCEIADRATFSLDELRYEYPEELCPPGRTPAEYLAQLTWQGAAARYPQGVPQRVRQLLEHELQLIGQLRYEAYFLTVWDLVRFARSRGILCQGRGSAANSAVCYCLGITSVDPSQIDVLFERFVSRERNEAPDIDVDFEHERREEVLQYLYDKYGRHRAAMTAEVITYRPRSTLRDVGKALGFSLDRVDRLARASDNDVSGRRLGRVFRAAGIDPHSGTGRRYAELVQQLLGFPRHLSQHVGGMVVTRGSLCDLVPIENAAMPGRTVVQWDKDDLDALGILKVDCLALGMLTAIRKCFALVAAHTGRRLTLADVPPEDPAVYAMIQQADTIGVFQIESRAQMSMLPRLRPACFYDLVIEVAIVRPGPIQGDMVHPYLRRRSGQEAVEYPDERIRGVLEKTLGVPIFQEQAMRLAVVAAGFTPGEADQLRKAMAAWRRPGVIDRFRQKLLDGMRARGYSEEFAARVFQQIRGFGEYGFPESHAASFALLVYVSAWLKRYYPAAFTAALLNSQPMGFYAPAQLVADARRHGVEVRPVDVQASDWDCTLEPAAAPGSEALDAPPHAPPPRWALRLGLRMVRGLSQADAQRIVAARQAGPFASWDDLLARTRLRRAALKFLAAADAFASLSLPRRQALWQALVASEPLPLWSGAPCGGHPNDEPRVALPDLSPAAHVVADYQTLGLSLRDHPLRFVRPYLRRRRVAAAAQLGQREHGSRVRVAGLVLLRQRPSSARGITFVTLEDETGQANLVIRPHVWERYAAAARTATALIASGELQRQSGVIHVVVSRLEDLSAALSELPARSRDFR